MSDLIATVTRHRAIACPACDLLVEVVSGVLVAHGDGLCPSSGEPPPRISPAVVTPSRYPVGRIPPAKE